ncbi:MAG TPA: helix-hairpin-helix domain-containing protein [Burkholderiales bacterium]|nr:helix-hairpin-helix domain-containing protein [Burkholderiales bacterium]
MTQAETSSSENQLIADKLREAAELLGAQGANPFRVNAYRKAADTISHLSRSVREIFKIEGIEGLDALPNIGRGIASAVAEILITERWAQLERLRGTTDPATLFQSVPGMGPGLAKRIHDTLHIETLEELESAAHDGRLESVPGVGLRRAAAWRAILDKMLGRVRARPARLMSENVQEPSVELLLDVDHEYREKGASGNLPKIVPKRFNPKNEAWLPVLHTKREKWHFTVLYSNTALAHKLGRLRDWVVLYFYDSDHVERQRTVVTETRGSLVGRRVVRGREQECENFYARPASGHHGHQVHQPTLKNIPAPKP